MKSKNSLLFTVLALLLVVVAPLLAPFANTTQAMGTSPGSPAVADRAAFDCTYTVRRGDTLFGIAVRFHVSYLTLAAVNGIRNPSLIFVGMVLRVPCSTPPPSPTICNIHIVQRGEWLSLIAARFGVSSASIASLNHLANPNLLFPGMRLLIPCPSGTPSRTITITSPTTGMSICSPVTTTGAVSVTPFEATLRGRVLNADDAVVGQATIHVTGTLGKPGTFSGQISFDTGQVKKGTMGRVEVADISPKDGSVLASSSVNVSFSCGQ